MVVVVVFFSSVVFAAGGLMMVVLFSTFFSSFAGGVMIVVFFSTTLSGAVGVTRASQATNKKARAALIRMDFIWMWCVLREVFLICRPFTESAQQFESFADEGCFLSMQ